MRGRQLHEPSLTTVRPSEMPNVRKWSSGLTPVAATSRFGGEIADRVEMRRRIATFLPAKLLVVWERRLRPSVALVTEVGVEYSVGIAAFPPAIGVEVCQRIEATVATDGLCVR
jgi:hypothetical protein